MKIKKIKILLSLLKIKFSKTQRILSLTILFSATISMPANAESQRFIDYDYDGAGNIISVRSGLNLGPPDVTHLSPAFIHKESFAFVSASGVNLLKATVATTTPGLNIVDVKNISATEIFVALFAESSAIIGPGSLTFSTRLGSDSEIIAIADRTPVISTDPNPILLLPDNQSRAVKLLFDRPFASDQVFDVLIQDTTLASISEQSITLLTGEREVSINVSGTRVGSTSLEINQLSNFLALAIPVIVSDPFQIPPGNFYISSKPLGVTVSRFDLPAGNNTIRSKPLRVLRNSFDLPSGNNKVISKPFRVLRNSFDLPSGNNKIISKPFRVLRNSFDLPTGQNRIISEALGVTVEPVADQMTPTQVFTGTSNTLTITGSALDSVTAVSFEPGSGIIQIASFSVDPGGTSLTIFIDVAANAAAGLRQIILTTPNGTIAFSVAGGDILEITQ